MVVQFVAYDKIELFVELCGLIKRGGSPDFPSLCKQQSHPAERKLEIEIVSDLAKFINLPFPLFVGPR